MVVTVGGAGEVAGAAEAVVDSLDCMGVTTVFLRERDASRIAAVVADERADTVELCIGESGGVLLLRSLLRELIRIGRRDTSIVVHKATQARPAYGPRTW